MMYCTSCGKELENNAKFCTSCGTSTQVNNKKGKIVFHRKNGYVGCLIDISVYVDGKLVGAISNGGTIEVPVDIGKHKVLFDLWSGVGDDIINVTEEFPNVYVDVKLKMGAFTNKPKIVGIRNER